jgi:hypothetical protein
MFFWGRYSTAQPTKETSRWPIWLLDVLKWDQIIGAEWVICLQAWAQHSPAEPGELDHEGTLNSPKSSLCFNAVEATHHVDLSFFQLMLQLLCCLSRYLHIHMVALGTKAAIIKVF